MASKTKPKVLVVDDSPVTIKLLEKLLSNDGYQVDTAYSGKEGIDKAKKSIPDLIILDVLMPDLDGTKVAREFQLTESLQKVPIIFTTNTINLKDDKGSEVITIEGITYRAFAKPLHHRKLLSVIRKEINKYINGN